MLERTDRTISLNVRAMPTDPDASALAALVLLQRKGRVLDAMTDTPEAVLVTEKCATGTQLTRLDSEKLGPWLEKYRLGQLWTRGEIGGTRW